LYPADRNVTNPIGESDPPKSLLCPLCLSERQGPGGLRNQQDRPSARMTGRHCSGQELEKKTREAGRMNASFIVASILKILPLHRLFASPRQTLVQRYLQRRHQPPYGRRRQSTAASIRQRDRQAGCSRCVVARLSFSRQWPQQDSVSRPRLVPAVCPPASSLRAFGRRREAKKKKRGTERKEILKIDRRETESYIVQLSHDISTRRTGRPSDRALRPSSFRRFSTTPSVLYQANTE
jgi:hypothetical protein